MLKIIKNKKSISLGLDTLRRSFFQSKVFQPSNITKFVFLCGANKSADDISERRSALIEFSKRNLPHTQFFLAEKMFKILVDEGSKKNILDIEHEISKFADHVVIILESESAFTELGAFSLNEELRKKLIIINNQRFINSKSFINLGPLKAIEEATGPQNLIYYKMKEDGVNNRDAIGTTFFPVERLLKEPIKSKASAINLDSCNPATNFTKLSAMFVHDLIYFTGPVNHAELVEVLKKLLDDQPFKLKEHLAILVAFGAISRNQNGIYKSEKNLTFYDYRFNTDNLITTFRNFILKKYPERIYGH